MGFEPSGIEHPRVLRDLLSVVALPATWVGQDPAFLARGIASALGACTGAVAILARAELPGRPPAHGTWVADALPAHDEAAPLLAALLEHAAGAPPLSPFALPSGRTGFGVSIGASGEWGALVAAGPSGSFPSPEDRLLFSIAASQCGTTLRYEQLAYELASTRRELAIRERQAAMGELVSGVAHEVRTPLTFIRNNLEVLRRRLDRAGRADDLAFVEDATSGVERIATLVEHLRPFGRRSDALVPIAFDAPVAQAVRLFRATHPAVAHIRVELAAPVVLPVEPLFLEQAVLNLLENAAEATGERGTVRLRTSCGPASVCLEVADDGPGIPPDLRDRIFEPFFTTKASGLGLGLAIVRRAVQSHGGRIAVDSPPEGGARFRLSFPIPEARPVGVEAVAANGR